MCFEQNITHSPSVPTKSDQTRISNPSVSLKTWSCPLLLPYRYTYLHKTFGSRYKSHSKTASCIVTYSHNGTTSLKSNRLHTQAPNTGSFFLACTCAWTNQGFFIFFFLSDKPPTHPHHHHTPPPPKRTCVWCLCLNTGCLWHANSAPAQYNCFQGQNYIHCIVIQNWTIKNVQTCYWDSQNIHSKKRQSNENVTKEYQFVHSTSETVHVQIQVDNTIMVLSDKSCTLCVKNRLFNPKSVQ